MRKKMQESILEEARVYNSLGTGKAKSIVLQRLTGKALMYEDVTRNSVNFMYNSPGMISAVIFEDRTVELLC